MLSFWKIQFVELPFFRGILESFTQPSLLLVLADVKIELEYSCPLLGKQSFEVVDLLVAALPDILRD
jgi:hypothetical protein